MFEPETEAKVEALCRHLRRMGLDATVVVRLRERSVDRSFLSFWVNNVIIGSVGISDRNIQFVELERQQERRDTPDDSLLVTGYRCNYVVRGRWEDLASISEVSDKPVRKSLLNRQVIDFKWQSDKPEGEELAKMLNNDGDLGEYFVAQKQRSPIFVWRHKEEKCVMISQKYFSREKPEEAFPTTRAFEAFDRIAQHIRSITNVRP